jgi:hypothetical protein
MCSKIKKMSPLKHLLQATTHGDVHSVRGARATASAYPCAQLCLMRRFMPQSASSHMLQVAQKDAPCKRALTATCR